MNTTQTGGEQEHIFTHCIPIYMYIPMHNNDFSLHHVFTYKTIKSCIINHLSKLTPLMVVIDTSCYTQGVYTYLPSILVNYRHVCGR